MTPIDNDSEIWTFPRSMSLPMVTKKSVSSSENDFALDLELITVARVFS